MERKVKVAFMLTPVEFGGLERVCLTLLKNINRGRFDLHPILLTRPWEPDNVFVRKLRGEGYDYCEIPVALRLNGDFVRIPRCYKLVYAAMKAQRFDLLHTHGYFADIVGIPVARRLGVPHLATCHGFITNTWKYRLYNRINLFALRFSTQIIAVSEGIKLQLLNSGLDLGRVRVIQNAIDLNYDRKRGQKVRRELRGLLKIGNKDFVLGYIGRLSEEKGLRHLLVACSQLVGRGVLIKAIILGDGPQRRELERLAEELKIRENLIFLGFQEHVHSWLHCMDSFVLPSLSEGTPMALLEAMACGVPVIATGVGGVPQLIESGKSGVLVQPGQPEEVTNAVLALLGDEMTRKRFSEAAHSMIESNFDIHQWMSRIEVEYLKLIG